MLCRSSAAACFFCTAHHDHPPPTAHGPSPTTHTPTHTHRQTHTYTRLTKYMMQPIPKRPVRLYVGSSSYGGTGIPARHPDFVSRAHEKRETQGGPACLPARAKYVALHSRLAEQSDPRCCSHSHLDTRISPEFAQLSSELESEHFQRGPAIDRPARLARLARLLCSKSFPCFYRGPPFRCVPGGGAWPCRLVLTKSLGIHLHSRTVGVYLDKCLGRYLCSRVG